MAADDATTVWHYSPVKAGAAYLPFTLMTIAMSLVVSRVLVTRIGVRPLLIAGPLLAGLGFIWLSRLSVGGSYLTSLLAPMLIVSAGLGLMFVPLTLMVVSHVAPQESGAASSMLNIGQQIGGSIGLAAIGTIAWTSVAHSVTSQMAARAASAGGVSSSKAAAVPTSVQYHALTVGFSTGLLVAAVVVLVGFIVAIVTTWRLSSAVHEGREQPCDEALGTCET